MDVRISKSHTVGGGSGDEVLELTGVAAEEISEERMRCLVNAAFQEEVLADRMGKSLFDWLANHVDEIVRVKRREPERQEAQPESGAAALESAESFTPQKLYDMRTIQHTFIFPAMLRRSIERGTLDKILKPFDEIDLPLDNGGTVTAVCGSVTASSARFVFKDCWDEGVMNDEPNNETGYLQSKGRAHVLGDILPHIAQEWLAIFKPRWMEEEIDGKRVVYKDIMWLPSATDVFGPSGEGSWKDLDDSFQLPIFKRKRDRVKEYGDRETYTYWLRSVNATSSTLFRSVHPSGVIDNSYANHLIGFAPGFDI